MADSYNCRPSDIFEIEESYERFCFDEACYYIRYMMAEEKKQPRFKDEIVKSANDMLKSGQF